MTDPFAPFVTKAEDRQPMRAEEHSLALAPNGIFWSIQGEGHLRGFQQAFLRLAGCGVGCDTNYQAAERLTTVEIVDRLRQIMPADGDQWVWITGGEPADLPKAKLLALLEVLKSQGWSTALATSGYKRVIPPVDWLSVSPHSSDPAKFQQRYGDEVKLVDGLNGLDLEEWHARWNDKTRFMYRYVQPLSRPVTSMQPRYEEDPESLRRCLEFLKRHPSWALSRQDHHYWGVA